MRTIVSTHSLLFYDEQSHHQESPAAMMCQSVCCWLISLSCATIALIYCVVWNTHRHRMRRVVWEFVYFRANTTMRDESARAPKSQVQDWNFRTYAWKQIQIHTHTQTQVTCPNCRGRQSACSHLLTHVRNEKRPRACVCVESLIARQKLHVVSWQPAIPAHQLGRLSRVTPWSQWWSRE